MLENYLNSLDNLDMVENNIIPHFPSAEADGVRSKTLFILSTYQEHGTQERALAVLMHAAHAGKFYHIADKLIAGIQDPNTIDRCFKELEAQ